MRDPRTGRYFASRDVGLLRTARDVHATTPPASGSRRRARRSPRTSRDVARAHLDRSSRARPTASCTPASPRRRCSPAPTRRDVGAEPRAVERPDAARVEPRRRRPGAALDLPVAGRSRSGWRSASRAAGVWITEDGGESWRTGYTGLVPAYVPEDQQERHARALRAQHASRAAAARAAVPAVPRQRLPLRRRRARRGTTSRKGCRRGFGFPMVVDPSDPDSAFVIPLDGRRRPRHARGQGAGLRDTRRGCHLDRARRRTARRATPTSRSSGRRSGTTAGSPLGCTSAPRRATCSARRTREPPGSRSTNTWRP